MKTGLTLDLTKDTTLTIPVIMELDSEEKVTKEIIIECDSPSYIGISSEFQRIIIGNSFEDVQESGLFDQNAIQTLITKKVAANYNNIMQELSESVFEGEEDLLANMVIKGKATYDKLPHKHKMKILKEVVNFQM